MGKKTDVILVVQAKPFLRNVGIEKVVTKKGKTRKKRKRKRRKTKMVLEFRTLFIKSYFFVYIIQYTKSQSNYIYHTNNFCLIIDVAVNVHKLHIFRYGA